MLKEVSDLKLIVAGLLGMDRHVADYGVTTTRVGKLGMLHFASLRALGDLEGRLARRFRQMEKMQEIVKVQRQTEDDHWYPAYMNQDEFLEFEDCYQQIWTAREQPRDLRPRDQRTDYYASASPVTC